MVADVVTHILNTVVHYYLLYTHAATVCLFNLQEGIMGES